MKEESELKYNGRRFQVIQTKYHNKEGVEYIRDCVQIAPAVVIIPVKENGDIIFIKQVRECIGKEMLELPAGVIEEGESPEEAAFRELKEETGIEAKSMTLLLEAYTATGYSNEKIYFYIAKAFSYGSKHLDADERIEEVLSLSSSQWREMLEKNQFEETTVLTALYAYLYNRSPKEF